MNFVSFFVCSETNPPRGPLRSSASSRNSSFGDVGLKKKIPINPKYQQTKSKINTGKNISNVKPKSKQQIQQIIEQNLQNINKQEFKYYYNKQFIFFYIKIFHQFPLFNVLFVILFVCLVDRSGELFHRITRKQLYELLLHIESGDETIYQLQEDDDDTCSNMSGQSKLSNMSSNSITPIISTITETKINQDSPLILLDIREEQAYNNCHIQGAIHYPSVLIRRDSFPAAVHKMVFIIY
jgi:hypothetical protein